LLIQVCLERIAIRESGVDATTAKQAHRHGDDQSNSPNGIFACPVQISSPLPTRQHELRRSLQALPQRLAVASVGGICQRGEGNAGGEQDGDGFHVMSFVVNVRLAIRPATTKARANWQTVMMMASSMKEAGGQDRHPPAGHPPSKAKF